MQLLLICQRRSVLVRLLEIIAKLDEISAKRSHRGILLRAVTVWNHDDGPQTRTFCRKSDALAMIATRGGDYSTQRRLTAAQTLHINKSAAYFERAQRRMILVLYPDIRADSRGQQRPVDLRRRRDRPVYDLRGGFDFLQRW